MQVSNMLAAQYYPGTSLLHRVDPRSKIVAACAYVIVLFLLDSFSAMAVMGGGLIAGIALAGIPTAWLWRGVRPVLYLIIFTAFFQVFLNGGEVIWQLGPIHVYREGIINTGFLAIRLILLVLSGSILTFTTPPVLLTDALGRIMSPLSKVRIPSYELALMMTIALRFIPTLVMEVDRIIKAQKARGALSGGGPVSRAKSIMPVMVPLFVMSFRHADELAAAMESRCWRGGKGRTVRRKLAYGANDAVFGLAVLVVLVISLLLGRFMQVI
ncbi:MAG: energy-coupling factor transporter transmembrane component T [Thermoleophilia bacterium]|nr:energy-coupling factor transporter transmembrane component T [Thermoleophilia bacterium]